MTVTDAAASVVMAQPEGDGIIAIRGGRRVFTAGSTAGSSKVQALRGVNLSIRRGEFVALMGSSGSGKSTLLNILGCLDTLDEGDYWFEGEKVRDLDADRRARLRNRRIGFIFQNFNLLPRLPAWENVALPLYYQGKPAGSARARAFDLLEQVGLSARSGHLPVQLSGGERQRVAIARALATEPAILLADEPTGNLDSVTGAEIMSLITGLNAQGRTILMVTHDHAVARAAGRRVLMRDGQLSEEGGSDDIL